jgi:hypothetical protein
MSLSISIPLLIFDLHRECGTCSLERLKGSYGGCADMGTFAAGLSVLLFAVGDVSLVVHFLQIVRRSVTECRESVDQLFALAFRDNAFDLVQSTVCTRCAMLDYIAADLTRATALASFGGSSLDTLGWSHAIRFEAGIGGSAFCIGRVDMDGVCGGRRRRIGEVVVHWIHCV